MRTFFLFFFVLLCGCVHHVQAPSHNNYQHPDTDFTRLVIIGPIDVTLRTGVARANVVLQGNPRAIAAIKKTLSNGVLTIDSRNVQGYGRVHAIISMRHITSLDYNGSGTISGSNLRSKALFLYITNTGNTTLDGQLGLQKLTVSGPSNTKIVGIQSHNLQVTIKNKARVQLAGAANVTELNVQNSSWFSLYWVKSNYLRVRAQDTAFVQLAGAVSTLDIVLRDKAQFHGRYLRAKSGFVKTFDRSIAEISIIDKQHTLASGDSNIYFYQLPKLKTDFMAFNGSVLDLRDWHLLQFEDTSR